MGNEARGRQRAVLGAPLAATALVVHQQHLAVVLKMNHDGWMVHVLLLTPPA